MAQGRFTGKSKITPGLLLDILLNDHYIFMPDTLSLNINLNIWNKYLIHRDKFETETRYLSSMEKSAQNEDYQEIIKMGDDVVKYILFDFIIDDVWHAFIALWAITNASPIQYKNRGRIDNMAQDWIKWGLKKKII